MVGKQLTKRENVQFRGSYYHCQPPKMVNGKLTGKVRVRVLSQTLNSIEVCVRDVIKHRAEPWEES